MTKFIFVITTLALAGCLGGQRAESQRESKLANVAENGPLPVTHPEHDWKKAATGHGAAGSIPQETLVDMEQKSAPGAMVKTQP